MLFCTKCGVENQELTKFCTRCGNLIQKKVNSQINFQKEIKENAITQVANEHLISETTDTAYTPPAKNKKLLFFIMISILMFGALAAWYFLVAGEKGTVKFVLPNDLKLRNSQFDGSDANIIASFRYGTEVTVLKEEGEWSTVKVDDQTGFMKNKYLVDGKDFFETDAIVRSVGVNDTINESRFKKSLLKYFRANNYTWHVQPQINEKYFGGSAEAGKLLWRIKETVGSDRTIVRGKFNGITKKGIGCIIENEAGTERKLLCFIYDEYENELFKAEFADNNLRKLELANKGLKCILYENNYGALPYDGIIVSVIGGQDKAIIYLNGNEITLIKQPAFPNENIEPVSISSETLPKSIYSLQTVNNYPSTKTILGPTVKMVPSDGGKIQAIVFRSPQFIRDNLTEVEFFSGNMQPAKDFVDQLTPGSLVTIHNIDVRGSVGIKRRIKKLEFQFILNKMFLFFGHIPTAK